MPRFTPGKSRSKEWWWPHDTHLALPTRYNHLTSLALQYGAPA